MDITDTLAMAVCMQLSEDYMDLMKRLNIKNPTPLKYDTYDKIDRMKTTYHIRGMDRNTGNLYNSILNKYTQYADVLKSRKYI